MRRSWLSRLRIVLLLALAAILPQLVVRLPSQQSLLRARLNRMADSLSLSDLSGLGDEPESMQLIVALLSSPREGAARAAEQTLRTRLREWESLGATEVQPKLQALAEALAEQVETFGPSAKAVAAEMAETLLQWPLGEATPAAGRTVFACHRTLRATSAFNHSPAPASEDTVPATPQPDLLAFLPMPSIESHATPPAALPVPRQPAMLGLESHLFSGERNQEPSASVTASSESRGSSGLQRTGTLPPARLPDSLGLEPTIHRESRAENSEVELAARVEKTSDRQTLALMFQLRSPDTSVVEGAEAELRALGFYDRQIELARQLVSPDPRVRRKLVATLPREPNINSATWLLWFVDDADADVRYDAMSLLATSTDPEVLHQIEQRAARDTDPRVLRLAELLQNNRSKGEEEKSAQPNR